MNQLQLSGRDLNQSKAHVQVRVQEFLLFLDIHSFITHHVKNFQLKGRPQKLVVNLKGKWDAGRVKELG